MVAQSCKAVIACRARKDQKAKLTRLVREGNREVVTLGVGDGANDVEMIRAAHIGVGIIGKEGTQAVNNADYAISQFRYLTRLILVYGHHEYRGITLAALLIFYKNILFTLIQYLYTFVCGLSGTRNQSYSAIFWYNTALTAFGPLLLAVFDKDVTDANCYRFPQLHRQGIEHRLFSVKRFLVYMAKAVYEAVAIGVVLNLVMSRADFPTGTLDVWMFGTIAVTINIFVANVSASIEQSLMMGVTVFFFWGTFVFWLLLVLFNSLSIELFPDYYGSFSLLFSRPLFYLVFLFATVLSLLPTLMVKAVQREWQPTFSQFIQDVQVRGADPNAVQTALEDMEKNRSLELELKTMKNRPRDAELPELMKVSPELVEDMEKELERTRSVVLNTSSPSVSSSSEPGSLSYLRTGNTQRSIRSLAGMRALTICDQLHGPSYDSQSVNSEAQQELIMKINSHSWRSIASPSKMNVLKNQILEATPSSILKMVSQSFKKTDSSSKSMMEQQSEKGLSVVKEEEEEKEEKVEKKEEAIVDEYPDEICLDPLVDTTRVESTVCPTNQLILQPLPTSRPSPPSRPLAPLAPLTPLVPLVPSGPPASARSRWATVPTRTAARWSPASAPPS